MNVEVNGKTFRAPVEPKKGNQTTEIKEKFFHADTARVGEGKKGSRQSLNVSFQVNGSHFLSLNKRLPHGIHEERKISY